jgi:kynurenine formamidase
MNIQSKTARLTATFAISLCVVLSGSALGRGDGNPIKGWKEGVGWGWIWGADDEVGALNAMTNETRLRALQGIREGRVYDLGVTFDRSSFRWPGHNPSEIITFRSPEGEKRQLDQEFIRPEHNPTGWGWHSTALFISDNVATQIDGLGHATVGPDNHWYNGFKEEDWGGNFGVRKSDAAGIPPIIARGVLLDIAGLKGLEALPGNYGITPADVDAALKRQKVEIRPGDVVLLRTGTLRYWGETGSDHEAVGRHASSGITLETAKHLVEDFGAMMIGSDSTGLEVLLPVEETETALPVHTYLLIEQGVHIGELHFLEELARDRAYEFTYIAVTNKIKGTTSGFTMRPLALR